MSNVARYKYCFIDLVLEQEINTRTLLALGALADTMRMYDPVWTKSVVSKVEQRVGIHGQ